MGRMNEDEMSMMCEWDLCDFPGFVLEVNLEKALDSSRPFAAGESQAGIPRYFSGIHGRNVRICKNRADLVEGTGTTGPVGT